MEHIFWVDILSSVIGNVKAFHFLIMWSLKTKILVTNHNNCLHNVDSHGLNAWVQYI
jgi:hypothetical protein